MVMSFKIVVLAINNAFCYSVSDKTSFELIGAVFIWLGIDSQPKLEVHYRGLRVKTLLDYKWLYAKCRFMLNGKLPRSCQYYRL
jgi:hypothetical protein